MCCVNFNERISLSMWSLTAWTLFLMLCVIVEKCMAQEVIHARLVGGDGISTGRVEVSRNDSSEWGTVCDDLWSEQDAQVLCRQLGFQWGTAHSNSPFGEGTGQIFLDNVQCTGSERSLADCQHNGWGVNNCNHYEDAGATCYNNSVRLQSRGRTDVGTVEIHLEDGWVQVCDEGWDETDARVLCREMGFRDAMYFRNSKLGKMSTDAVSNKALTRFSCRGHETKLINCTYDTLDRKCSVMNRASAICYNQPKASVNMSFSVDLANGSDYWGEVSIRKHGIWGQVCASRTEWNDLAAKVVCRQKGFEGGKAYGTVNETLRPIWITQLNCSGTERSLEDCVSNDDTLGRPVRSCRVAYALCYRRNVTIDLAGGGEYYGRVEITYDGTRGTVCDKSWSTSDARVLCKYLGYADGEPVSSSYYGSGTGPIMMNGLGCYGQEKSLLQCRNYGWMTYNQTDCVNHTKDASVICYKNVRLSRGDHSYGVVQVKDNYWSVLCGEGFDNKDALVICKQLGFSKGRSLPPGSFGTFYGRYTWPNVNCTGNESSIADCPHDRFRGCQRDNYLGYAAVSCYNGSLSQATDLKIEDGSGSNASQSGRIAIKQFGIWGRICPASWDNNDAKVVCRSRGFMGGVAYQESTGGNGPFFLGQVNCLGNETDLFQCDTAGEECESQYSGAAGVLCYRERAPSLHLVGGTHNSGRLEIIIDREVGSICDVSWSRYDASVACKQLGFRDGEYRRGLSGPVRPKFLSSMNCFGSESSIFMCRNPGWKRGIDSSCSRPNRNAGVFCYNNVRISGGESRDNVTTGRVQMYQGGKWKTVCAEGFDSNDAKVVCRELGFSNSKVLLPGSFGSKYYFRGIYNLSCTGNEATVNDCTFSQEGTCSDRSYNYASVLCAKYSVDTTEMRITASRNFPATVMVEKHGINGTICSVGWTDKDAKVACNQLGYQGGVAFGPRYHSSRSPFWMSNISCLGNESSLSNCPYNVTWSRHPCRSHRLSARVFCYRESGFQIRLAGTDNAYSGRVEIAYNNRWGTICDSYWSKQDARVVCRQLGFKDGISQPRSHYGAGTGPSWLYYVRCDGDEDSIWQCGNSGWNVTHSSCTTHRYDAGVHCTGHVRLDPNITFGAVQIWQEDKYSLVCADEFDDLDAQVVCRTLGFQNGISICCSVFGTMSKYKISINEVQCTGSEYSILDCQYTVRNDACPSKKYAAVACSNSASSGAYELRLSSGRMGVVEVRHLDLWGSICPEGFDDNDARVLCREMNYRDGFSYYYYSHENSYKSNRQWLPWLSNMNCTGSEGYLARCGNIRWGDVRNCSKNTLAAAYCTANTSNVQVRLVNGTNNLSGRVELSINGEWGTICGSSYWDDSDATVLCRMMNHSSGRALKYGHYGRGTGPIWIGYLRCKGRERSIFHCPMSFNSQSSRNIPSILRRSSPIYRRVYTCSSHAHDAGVQCYDSVRLMGSNSLNYGRLEMYVNNSFTSVCDHGFDDKAASVVCRQLGYNYGRKQCCSALSKIPTANITVTDVNCNGNETKLNQCRYRNHPCSTGKYVSVYCSANPIVPNELRVRISSSRYYGAIEAKLYDFWGPVCKLNWDDHDANVTCHQLNFAGGVAFYGTTSLSTPVAVGRFNCTGQEDKLEDCPFKKMGDIGCSRDSSDRPYSRYSFSRPTAGVLCYNNRDGIDYAIEGTRTSGSVKVKFNGEWGRVCQSAWDNDNAKVFCKQLGFVDGKKGPRKNVRGTGHVWLDHVRCKGTEKTILECSATWDPHYASCDDAQVICMDAVRLKKGDSQSHGIVEVHLNDKWGMVCNHEWNSPKNINVTCRQLGYNNGLSVCCGAYGYLYSSSLIDHVRCDGNEDSLLQCPSDHPYGSCSVDYAAVACFNGTLSNDYTLDIKGSSNTSGAIDIKFMNISGRICADDWDDKDAVVACRELGFSRGFAYKHKLFFGDGQPIWANKVNCSGSENTLKDCPNFSLGSVRQCTSRLDAGVLCYSSLGVNFRIAGGTSAYGRVEISVDGRWGTLCKRYWDKSDATAFCRYLGYAAGAPYSTDQFKITTGPVYEPNLHCKGDESTLMDCPHEGWNLAQTGSSCLSHEKDAMVHCYQSVKLDTGVGMKVKSGPVLYYHNQSWHLVCDKDFTDLSARKVCQELGFVDGRAICCSGYGKNYQSILANKSLSCTGEEKTVSACLKPSTCGKFDTYASVICLNQTDMNSTTIRTGVIKINFTSQDSAEKGHGEVAVHQFGTVGRISTNFWDDKEAQVFCRSLGYKNGLAYQHKKSRFRSGPPFLLGDFNCTGSEALLVNCSFNNRLKLGNMTISPVAGALCFNHSGIHYRIAGPYSNQGRVEVSVNNVWGTVCDMSWDNREAGVFCRMMNYSDGYAIPGAHYGAGTGPIWLSHLRCNGTEKTLHYCAHEGFSEKEITKQRSWIKCDSHKDDASVYCVDKLRLNLGYSASMGAVEVYQDNKWFHLCDDTFDNDDARVICRTLNFRDGKAILGSSFGNATGSIGFNNINCKGDEGSFFDCSFRYTSRCEKKTYASVYCSNQTLINTAFEMKIEADDALSSESHGEVLVKIKGMWGSVCLKGFGNSEANVVCKSKGFKGGEPYLVPKKKRSKYPMIMSHVQCRGTESSLEKCSYVTLGHKENCHYDNNRAGVLCYKETGVNYKLVGGSDPSHGRVEISYENKWGGICDFLWDTKDATVLCRSMNYKSGLEISGARYGQSEGPLFFTRMSCSGSESNLLVCDHSGFNMSLKTGSTYERLCRKKSHDAAARCYQKEMAVSAIRLIDGGANYGRVEVFLTGPDRWGTVCDDYFDNRDATVICKQLGFAQGIAKKRATFGRGNGPIWMDNLDCFGNESNIMQCTHNGFNVENCNHAEDAGVICNGTLTKKSALSELSDENSIAAAVTVPIIILLLIVLAITGFFLYRYMQPKAEIKKVLVDNETMEPGSQASASASSEGQVTFSKLKAHFSKPKSSIQNGSETKTKGIGNPNYENMTSDLKKEPTISENPESGYANM